MRVHRLSGFLYLNKREFLKAIQDFRALKDLATEADQDAVILDAFNMLGLCY